MANEQRKVWLQDKELAWVKAVVVDEGGSEAPRILTVEREDTAEKTQVEVDLQTGEGDSVKARNLFEEDSDIRGYEQVHDLTHLTHLHEAEILEALSMRFQNDQIYTYTGPILLAVNPFKELKIYTEDILGTYYSAGLLKSQQLEGPQLRPHVFAIADAAYRNLMESSGVSTRMDQSILVSGESGAGKTETTKYVMRYLATVARAEDAEPSEKGRAERVLESNPILESFGNARTNRNDNSSRFGKFIQMSFDGKGFLVGAQIVTYLLEKVRLTKQGKGERNFHVFYQMCAGASEEDRGRWMLPTLEESLYTNQSDVYERRDGVLDADQFTRTDEALTKMKFTSDERDSIYSVASAVMNMGNVGFDKVMVGGNDGSAITGGHEAGPLKNVSSLLAVSPDLLVTALTTKTITTGKETFTKALDIEEAGVVRDALAKTIYSRLFDWIVKRVNIAISTDATKPAPGGKASASAPKHSFIGVLDIFGFEVFEHNSFEQLCINYANETLQQQFNEFVFQLEQKLYESEKIQWQFIDFPDNKPVLDLIEAKAPKPGILALLDEQCLFPQGNDKALANKLYDMLGGGANGAKVSPAKGPAPGSSPAHPSTAKGASTSAAASAEGADLLLFANPADRRDSKFCVRHYAGVVTYSAIGFCAKNKDELREEVLALMRTSAKELVLQLFPETASVQANKAGSVQSETVGSQFKGQLASLLKTIKATSPHYVRCLKPNDQNVRETLVRPRVVDQLRYGGVLEAVKVARAGYPTRFSLRDFVRRYFMLSANMKMALSKRAQTFGADDERWVESCEMIVNGPEKLEKGTQFQIGRTKMFLRKSAFEKLETARSKVFKTNSTEIQKISRGFIRRRSYTKTMGAIRLIQRIARGFIGRRRARAIRRNNAALKIQAVVRQFVQRSKFMRMKEAAMCVQRIQRGHLGRKRAKGYRIFVKAQTIQCFFRSLKARRDFARQKKAAIRLQTNWRGLLGRRELKQLRMQQREAGFLKDKIIELQRKITELEDELRQERAKNKSVSGAVQAVVVAKSEPVVHAPPERPSEEEPDSKRRPPVAQVDAAEVQALRAELAQAQADKRRASEETEIAKREAEARAAALATAVAERDSLAKGADPQDLISAALAERDRARDELVSARAEAAAKAAEEVEALRREMNAMRDAHAAALAAAMTAPSTAAFSEPSMIKEGDGEELAAVLRKQIAVMEAAHAAEIAALKAQPTAPAAASSSNDGAELQGLKKQMADLEAAHAKEIAALQAVAAVASSTLPQQPKPQQDASPSAVSTEEIDAQLTAAKKEAEKLKSQLARAKEEVARISEERDSLSMLVSSSPDALEATLKAITDERDKLVRELAQQKEAIEALTTERNAMASMSKADSSEDDRVRALADQRAVFDKERARLAEELEMLSLERDELKSKLSDTKMALEKKTAHTSPLTPLGSSRDGSEVGSAIDDIDSQLARSTVTELELAKEVLTKENEDLKEEKTKLMHRIEELEHMSRELKERMDQQSGSQRKRFFSRPSVSPAAVTSPTAVSSTSDAAKSLPTRSEVLAAKNAELEIKLVDMTKQKDDLFERIMHLTNDGNGKDTEIRKLRRSVADLMEKIEAMSTLAEQTSAIKIKLARRLDSLITERDGLATENTSLKQSLSHLEEQVAAMKSVSQVLNDELMTMKKDAAINDDLKKSEAVPDDDAGRDYPDS